MKRLLIALATLVLGAGLAAAQDTAPPRRIALTFDDAPRGDGRVFTGPGRTQALIAALEAAGVDDAMIFVTGGNVEGRPQGEARIAAYAAAGHSLANHSYSHTWLHRTEPEAYLADIDRASVVLDRFERTAPFFRFPYLDEGRTEETRDAVRAGLAERGLRNGYVTVDTYDWYMEQMLQQALTDGRPVDRDALRDAYVELHMAGVAFADDVAVETLGRSPAHVLLLHENDLAALFIGDLVAALRSDDWEIIPATEAFEDPISDVVPDTLFNGQGRVAAIAHAAGRPARELVSPQEDEAWLEAEFARRGVFGEAPGE